MLHSTDTRLTCGVALRCTTHLSGGGTHAWRKSCAARVPRGAQACALRRTHHARNAAAAAPQCGVAYTSHGTAEASPRAAASLRGSRCGSRACGCGAYDSRHSSGGLLPRLAACNRAISVRSMAARRRRILRLALGAVTHGARLTAPDAAARGDGRRTAHRAISRLKSRSAIWLRLIFAEIIVHLAWRRQPLQLCSVSLLSRRVMRR